MTLRLLLLGALMAALPRPAPAQAQRQLYERALSEGDAAGFRLADTNERWFAMERDRDDTHQELLVLRARDGATVLRAEGMSLPAGARHSVVQLWDLTVRPYLPSARVMGGSRRRRGAGADRARELRRLRARPGPARGTLRGLRARGSERPRAAAWWFAWESAAFAATLADASVCARPCPASCA